MSSPPVVLTVASGIELLVQEPPVVASLSNEVVSTHTIGVPVMAEGIASMFTVTVAVLTQPKMLVPATVYVVTASGLAITVAPVLADKVAAGDQV